MARKLCSVEEFKDWYGSYESAGLSSANHPNRGNCESDDEKICQALEEASVKVYAKIAACIDPKKINQVLDSSDSDGNPYYFGQLKCWTRVIAYKLLARKIYRGPNGQPVAHFEAYQEAIDDLNRFSDPEFCRCGAALVASTISESAPCITIRGCRGNRISSVCVEKKCKPKCGCCACL